MTGEAIALVVVGALITGVVSGLLGSWITVHVLQERLSGFERWLRAVQSDVKKMKDDLYKPVLLGEVGVDEAKRR